MHLHARRTDLGRVCVLSTAFILCPVTEKMSAEDSELCMMPVLVLSADVNDTKGGARGRMAETDQYFSAHTNTPIQGCTSASMCLRINEPTAVTSSSRWFVQVRKRKRKGLVLAARGFLMAKFAEARHCLPACTWNTPIWHGHGGHGRGSFRTGVCSAPHQDAVSNSTNNAN